MGGVSRYGLFWGAALEAMRAELRAARAEADELRTCVHSTQAAAQQRAKAHDVATTVLLVELLQVEAERCAEATRAQRLRGRLDADARMHRRTLKSATRESEARFSEERAELERQLADSAKLAETKLRVERQRLAVRYTNQGKTMVQQKLSAARREFEAHLGAPREAAEED